MPRFSPVNAIVTSVDLGGGKAVIELKAAKSTLTVELAEDSPWVRFLTEGSVVSYTFDVATAQAADVVTATTTLEVSSRAADGIVDPSTGQLIEGKTYATPASDIPAPTITNEHPAVVTSNQMANAPIADVKAALGL